MHNFKEPWRNYAPDESLKFTPPPTCGPRSLVACDKSGGVANPDVPAAIALRAALRKQQLHRKVLVFETPEELAAVCEHFGVPWRGIVKANSLEALAQKTLFFQPKPALPRRVPYDPQKFLHKKKSKQGSRNPSPRVSSPLERVLGEHEVYRPGSVASRASTASSRWWEGSASGFHTGKKLRRRKEKPFPSHYASGLEAHLVHAAERAELLSSSSSSSSCSGSLPSSRGGLSSGLGGGSRPATGFAVGGSLAGAPELRGSELSRGQTPGSFSTGASINDRAGSSSNARGGSSSPSAGDGAKRTGTAPGTVKRKFNYFAFLKTNEELRDFATPEPGYGDLVQRLVDLSFFLPKQSVTRCLRLSQLRTNDPLPGAFAIKVEELVGFRDGLRSRLSADVQQAREFDQWNKSSSMFDQWNQVGEIFVSCSTSGIRWGRFLFQAPCSTSGIRWGRFLFGHGDIDRES